MVDLALAVVGGSILGYVLGHHAGWTTAMGRRSADL